MNRLWLVLLLMLSVVCAQAEEVFIRDTLYVPLRGGTSSEHRILHKGLRSGTRLERLEFDSETDFSRVRTNGGLEGWIHSQYLVTEPIAADKLDDLTAKLSALEVEFQQTLALSESYATEAQNGAKELETIQTENAATKLELTRITNLAADVITINENNQQLKQEREQLNSEINDLYAANSNLEDTRNQAWFLRGAGTILLGLLFGFWVARRLYHSQKSSWS